MVVETQAVPLWLSRSYYNRFCFLQYEQQVEKMLLPEDWKEVRNMFIQISYGHTCTLSCDVMDSLHGVGLFWLILVTIDICSQCVF